MVCPHAKERGCGKQGKLPHLFIPSKTVTLVTEFAMEDLPLSRNATLVSVFCSERPALWQNTMIMVEVLYFYANFIMFIRCFFSNLHVSVLTRPSSEI